MDGFQGRGKPSPSQRRARLRQRLVAVCLGLSIEAALLSFFLFTTPPAAPPMDLVSEVRLVRLPLREPPPREPDPRPPPPPAPPPPLTPRTPAPAPLALPAPPPLPIQGAGRGASGRGDEPPDPTETAQPPRRLNLGCLGRSLEHMSPQERRNCEVQLARIPGIPADVGPGVDPATLTAWNAAADRRRQEVYPSGNNSHMGCPEGNMTGCVDQIMIPLGGRRF